MLRSSHSRMGYSLSGGGIVAPRGGVTIFPVFGSLYGCSAWRYHQSLPAFDQYS
jgi:hypothetical protein